MSRLSPEQSRLVEQYYPRVAPMARSIAATVSHVNIDDLHSAGHEGLVEAALRFDPDAGVPFAAFAHYRVRGAMIDAARRAAPQVRRRNRAMRALQASQALLEEANRTQPSREVADPRSLQQRVAAAAALVAQTSAAVMLSRLGPVDPESVADAQRDPEEAVALALSLSRLRALVDACDDDAKRLIEALYVEGFSMHEYAAQLGISVSTISRHHARIVGRLASQMQGRSTPES
jgi:RNA polymerase sigma factor for flagellar operon FliA